MGSLMDRCSAMVEERKTIDMEVERISKMVNSRDKGLNSEDISFVVSSIQDFSRNYQTLCGKYDDLVCELKTAFEQKGKANEDSSPMFSSPRSFNFEADEFSDSVISEKGKTNEESSPMFASARSFNFELDEFSDIVAPDKADESIRLGDELQSARERMACIEIENRVLREKLEICNQQMADLNRRMVSEQTASFERIQDADKANAELKSESNVLKGEVSDLHVQLDRLSNMLVVRDEELKSVTEQKLAAITRIQLAESEKSTAETMIKDLREEVSALHRDISDVRSRNTDLETNLEGKRVELQELQESIASERKTMSDHTKCLQLENDSPMNDLEEQLQMLARAISEANVMIITLESELVSRIESQEKMLVVQKEELARTASSYRAMKDERSRKMDEELEAKAERISQLEIITKECKSQAKNSEECNREILEKLRVSQAAKGNADKEAARLNELVQTLEVHLRLLDRKLKITKSEFKEKEESYKKKVKELQQKCTQLEENCDTMYEEICYREKEFEEIKEVVTNAMNCIVDNIENAELAFQESWGHLETRVSECSEDLNSLKGEVGLLNLKRRGLEREKHQHEEKLLQQEESLRLLEDEASLLQRKLSTKDEEGRRLVVEMERRAREIEGRLHEKDEEKREAIRQLCVVIEYHRENFDELSQSLLSAKGGRMKHLS